jgi:hypothetical protein
MSGSPFTVMYAGRAIGHVLFGMPAENGHRVGALVPTPEYIESRPALRRWLHAMQATDGRSGEEIHQELVAQIAELRASGLSLLDATGEIVETQLLCVMDAVPDDTPIDVVLFAPLIYVAATFSTPTPDVAS